MKRIIFLGSIIVFATSCAMSGYSNSTVPVGASWDIMNDIVFRPRHSTVYIQDGEIVPTGWKGNQYQPYCTVELKSFSKNKRVLKSGRFEITRVIYDSQAIDETISRYSTIMTVKSLEQPDVKEIGCHHWDDNVGDFMPVEKMQKTMEGLFFLNLPEAPKTTPTSN
jgi:hypothetical protein